MTVTKRIDKGSPLTWAELDANFDHFTDITKPKAGANKTVALVQGSKNLVQAFEELDAFNYEGKYSGTITVPTGYIFDASDSMILYGRRDCGWLKIISDQFPTMHTISAAPPAGNIFGYFSAFFGAVQSTIHTFAVSIDCSSASTSFYPIYFSLSDFTFIGNPFTNTNMVVRSPSPKTYGAYIQDCSILLIFFDGDRADIASNSIGNAVLRCDSTGPQGFRVIGNQTAGSISLTVGDNSNIVAHFNTSYLYLAFEAGVIHASVNIGGKVQAAPVSYLTPSYLKAMGSGRVFNINAETDFTCTSSGLYWRPSSTGERLFGIASSYVSGNYNSINALTLELDTTDAVPDHIFSSFLYVRNATVNAVRHASWDNASLGVVDILPNFVTADGSSYNDPSFKAWKPITLLNSWVNIGGSAQQAQYRIVGDMVDIRFAIQNGVDHELFSLPTNMIPPQNVGFACQLHDNTGAPDFGHINISNTGSVVLEHPGSLSNHKVWATFSYSVSPS